MTIEKTETPEWTDAVTEAVTEAVTDAISASEEEGPKYEMVEKVTPGANDVSWWVKWGATIFSLIGAVLTASVAANPASVLVGWNIPFIFLGLIGWGMVGMMWRDNSLIIMNVFLAGIYCMSLIQVLQLKYDNPSPKIERTKDSK
jgi:hypothetical protein